MAIKFVYTVSNMHVKCKILCSCVEVSFKKSMRVKRGSTRQKVRMSLTM
jgi:hypothetical protein